MDRGHNKTQQSRRLLIYALHLAASIVIGVIAIEVMPEVLSKALPWAVAPALLAGGLFYLLLEGRLDAIKERLEASTSSWMIYAAVTADGTTTGKSLCEQR